MEPVKGGKLANPPQPVKDILQRARSTSGRLLPTGRKNIKNNHNMKTVNFWRAAMMLPVMLLTTATA